jgi:4-hydroxy-3-methylbut-2-enyl diphosphate reductase
MPLARVVRTGMGPHRSRRSARRLRDSGDAALAVAGLCGALDSTLAPGDVVVASELVAAGQRRGCPGADLLLAALRDRGVVARLGTIRCVDHLVRRGERERLRENGAIAVDMESLWLAEAAGDRPFAVLRVVVDTPGRELFRLGLIPRVRRSLRALRCAAPALEEWSAELGKR